MKLTVLSDNLTQRNDLITEHGLSYYIESGDKKILFDTGQSGSFIQNAEKLGVDLKDVDYLILSHGHFDHAGGISDFLELNKKAVFILKSEAMLDKFSYKKYIGMPRGIRLPMERMLILDSYLKISRQIYVLGEIHVYHPSQTHFDHFFTRRGKNIVPDTFNDELFLVLLSEESLGIVTACSHHGITNIIGTAKNKFRRPVKSVIGGFHLKDSNSETVIEVAEYLKQEKTEQIITGHCTGFDNYLMLKKTCNNICYGYCGQNYPIKIHQKTLKNENSNTFTQ